jgi:hypothetical protein
MKLPIVLPGPGPSPGLTLKRFPKRKRAARDYVWYGDGNGSEGEGNGVEGYKGGREEGGQGYRDAEGEIEGYDADVDEDEDMPAGKKMEMAVETDFRRHLD